ncbi:MAG: hypothetical protein LBR10_01995 [Prevotellaceae bacterium]|nr:hypothetical protein [Prevotellaceae bacterium]
MTNFKVGIMIRKAQSGQMICLKINRNNVTVHSININVSRDNAKVSRANIKVNQANPKVNKTNIQSAKRIYVHRHMASCVLSTSKHFQYLKITCPHASCQGEKMPPKSAFFRRYSITGLQQQIKRRRVFTQKTVGFFNNR